MKIKKAEIVKEDEETSGSSSPITYSDLSSKNRNIRRINGCRNRNTRN